MNNEEVKYFIYVRKSSEGKERQALSHEGQLMEIQKIVEREDLTVVDTFQESKSAHIPDNRPMFNQMLKRIKKGHANGIIAWHTNRLSRNPKEAGIIQQLLQDEIIKSIIVPYRHFRSEDNALLFSIESSEANQYSRDLKVAVKRGLHQKCMLGQPPIIAPPGYSNTKSVDSGSNAIIVDKERFHLMRKAFDLILSRQYTIGKVASILNNEYHFRTRASRQRMGSPISISMLHRAFTNQFYTGYFKYRDVIYKGKYPPMITLEEFDTVQKILGRNLVSKPHKHEFAFTGIMRCPACGCAITASRKQKKLLRDGEYKTYTFYHCTKRRGYSACNEKHYTTESEIEAMIEAELKKLTIIPKWKEWIMETLQEDHQDELAKQQELLKATKDYERKLLIELDNLLNLRISNDLTESEFRHKKAEREALLLRVQERVKRIGSDMDLWINDVKHALDFTEDLINKFKNGEPAFKKDVCKQLGWNWTLQGKKLLFTRHAWFQEIEQVVNRYNEDIERLEPIKTFIEYRETVTFQAVRPYLSRLRDVIRNNESNYGQSRLSK